MSFQPGMAMEEGPAILTTHHIASCHVRSSSRQEIWKQHNELKNCHVMYDYDGKLPVWEHHRQKVQEHLVSQSKVIL
jgi:hypothetical protein